MAPSGVPEPKQIKTEYIPRHTRDAETSEFQRYVESQEEDKYSGIHRGSVRRFIVTGGMALTFSIVGLVVGWLVFGLPSLVGLIMGWVVLRREDESGTIAAWAFYMGILGVFMGLVTLMAVLTT